MKQLQKWKSRLKIRRLSTIAIAVTSFISVSIILLTIYGANVGNFVVTVEEGFRASLALSEDREFTEPKSLLSAEGLRSMTDTSYEFLHRETWEQDGSYNGPGTFTAYSFYIKNVNDRPVHYSMEITMRRVYKNVDYAIWIMVIKDGVKTVYAKPKTLGFGDIVLDEQNQVVPEDADGYYPGLTKPFASTSTLALESYFSFPEGEVSRFTVVMWLEGHDPQCLDQIKGGSIQLDMRFFAVTDGT